jgi:hypothetical protein
MRLHSTAIVCACALLTIATAGLLTRKPVQAQGAKPAPAFRPEYTQDGKLVEPANYRQWVYLTSGFDMTYRAPNPNPGDNSVFDNVFVNPDAYASFLETGTWPDKTVMVLEIRKARSTGEPLVKGGRFQSTELAGIEVHVKDSARFHRGGSEGTWGFFDVNLKDGTGQAFPPEATCFSCHQAHAAVDTTFVQFYPTLLPLAEKKGTLSDAYRSDHNPAAP